MTRPASKQAQTLKSLQDARTVTLAGIGTHKRRNPPRAAELEAKLARINQQIERLRR